MPIIYAAPSEEFVWLCWQSPLKAGCVLPSRRSSPRIVLHEQHSLANIGFVGMAAWASSNCERGRWLNPYQKTRVSLSFPCVCPEPVWVK